MRCPRCEQLEDNVKWQGNALHEIHRLVHELERHSKFKIKRLENENGDNTRTDGGD